VRKRIDAAGIAVVSKIYPQTWTAEARMSATKQPITPDSIVSCLGLLFAGLLGAAALWVLLLWQLYPWLKDGVWHSYPLSWCCAIHTDWVGLQLIFDWIWRLPVTLLLGVLATFVFWIFGLLASKMYQWVSRRSAAPVTPSQTRV
jgi:hypothetical protein